MLKTLIASPCAGYVLSMTEFNQAVVNIQDSEDRPNTLVDRLARRVHQRLYVLENRIEANNGREFFRRQPEQYHVALALRQEQYNSFAMARLVSGDSNCHAGFQQDYFLSVSLRSVSLFKVLP